MKDKVSIKKEYVLNAYKHASEEQKALLESMFGKDMFQPKNIMERVKTFEDACEVLGEDHQYVLAYREWMRISYANCKDISAYLKLRIICAALNEGWKPTFSDDECTYYPWFFFYTKDEYDELDEDVKKECHIIGRLHKTLSQNGGIVFVSSINASSNTYSHYGFMIAFKTLELAKYCGKQFIDIWVDYLFG